LLGNQNNLEAEMPVPREKQNPLAAFLLLKLAGVEDYLALVYDYEGLAFLAGYVIAGGVAVEVCYVQLCDGDVLKITYAPPSVAGYTVGIYVHRGYDISAAAQPIAYIARCVK